MTTDTAMMDLNSAASPIDRVSGGLSLLTGPMFAGKSAALFALATAEQRRLAGHDGAVLVLKPAFDTRDGSSVVSSRDGTRIAARPVSCWPADAADRDVVVIDEVQFMVSPHYAGDIVDDILRAVRSGCHVVAGGLDTDYARRPFEPVSRLAEHATRHVRLCARCHECDAPACWTAKRQDTGRRLELGSDGLYEARCDQHWSLPGQPADTALFAAASTAAAIVDP